MPVADARSESAIVHLRFHRSTRTPAIGLMMIIGAKPKNATIDSAVARPVVRYAHSVSANPVIAVPTRDTTCPNQTMVNAVIPFGLCDDATTVCSSVPATSFMITPVPLISLVRNRTQHSPIILIAGYRKTLQAQAHA